MPEISVITACRPSEPVDMLLRCYQSIVNQRSVEWEWVLVFDGRQEADLPSPIREDERVLVFYGERFYGAAHCRNRAAAAALAPVLRNLDSDDWLLAEDALRRVLDAVDRGAGLCTGAVYVDYGQGDTRNYVSTPEDCGMLPVGYVGDRWAARGDLGINVMSLGIRADLFWCCGGYRAMTYAEDIALVVSANDIAPLWVEREPLMAYTQWDGQINKTIARGWEFARVHEHIVRATGREYIHGVV